MTGQPHAQEREVPRLNLAALLPLVSRLGDYLQSAITLAGQMQASGPDPEATAALLNMKMTEWDPKILGKAVLDPPTRAAASRFLAGVACNLFK